MAFKYKKTLEKYKEFGMSVIEKMKNEIKYWNKKGFGFSDLKQYEVEDYITLHDYGHMVINEIGKDCITLDVLDYKGESVDLYKAGECVNLYIILEIYERMLKNIMYGKEK